MEPRPGSAPAIIGASGRRSSLIDISRLAKPALGAPGHRNSSSDVAKLAKPGPAIRGASGRRGSLADITRLGTPTLAIAGAAGHRKSLDDVADDSRPPQPLSNNLLRRSSFQSLSAARHVADDLRPTQSLSGKFLQKAPTQPLPSTRHDGMVRMGSANLGPQSSGSSAQTTPGLLRNVLQHSHHKKAPQAPLVEALQNLFEAYDQNSDRTIYVDEFVSSELILAPEVNHGQAVAAFFKANTSGSGGVSFPEFKKYQIDRMRFEGIAVEQMISCCESWAQLLKHSRLNQNGQSPTAKEFTQKESRKPVLTNLSNPTQKGSVSGP